jgi:hypothetical protein
MPRDHIGTSQVSQKCAVLTNDDNCDQLGSEGQEKYVRELSVTPVGYFFA